MQYLLTIICNRLYAPVHSEDHQVDMGSGNLIIVQGGGPTAVLNSSLACAIAEGAGRMKLGTARSRHANSHRPRIAISAISGAARFNTLSIAMPVEDGGADMARKFVEGRIG